MNKPTINKNRTRLLLCASLTMGASLWAQQAVQQQDTKGAEKAPKSLDNVPTEKVSTDDQTIELSPFEVVAQSKGYYQANSMSGTRLNSKIDDLASAITVVTKEQMSDFAMIDINDVFLYTASTEGSGTYTSFSVDRNGSVSDGVQSNPTNANRVRGIAPANISYGNYETMGRVPVDPIGMDGIEISRGPNANVFGLGNPSGTVNMVPADANVRKNKATVEIRADSYDGYRSSLDVNRVLIKGKLAFRTMDLFQHEGFTRKPSGVDTTRLKAALKYTPFKGTTITGSLGYYRSQGNRPNFVPPRDNVSYWIQSGKPTWDPVTQTIHMNGSTVGTYTYNKSGWTGPDYFYSTAFNSFTGAIHSFASVDQNGLGYWSAPATTTSTAPLWSSSGSTVAASSPTYAYMVTTSMAGTASGKSSTQPLWTTSPSVSDKSIYDWSKINLSSVNYDWDTVTTSNVQLEQIFINNQTNLLVAQAGFLRENAERYRRDLLGTANDNGMSGQLFVDVNERNLDGSVNPYFGRLYMGTDQPRTTINPARWDTYRTQVAYRLDLTQSKGWLKYLGIHQFVGYAEYKYRIQRNYSFRDAMTSNTSWLSAGTVRGNQGSVTGGYGAAPALTRMYWKYYVSDNVGTNVDYAPSNFQYGTYNYTWGGNKGFNTEPVTIGQVAVTDAAGGNNNTKTELKTIGASYQSFLLDNCLVTTLGIRSDKQFVKYGNPVPLLNQDGMTYYYPSMTSWSTANWKYNSGHTTTDGFVVRPFKDLPWARKIDGGDGVGHFVSGLLRGLSLTYNNADSFLPQDPKVNLYLQSLPNSTGKGKDIGFGLSLFDNKMVVRFTHYDNKQLNARGTDASTMAQRLLRLELPVTGATAATYLLQTQATGWATTLHPDWTTSQVQDYVAGVMQMTTSRQQALVDNSTNLASTQDVRATGNELEINFNPSNNWTMVISGTENKSINSNLSPELSQWISERMPVWTSIVDPVKGTNWWTTNYGGSQTAQQNYTSWIKAPLSVILAQQGKSNPQIRRYNFRYSTSYKLAGLTNNRFLRNLSVGGAVRYESRGAIGYYGLQSLPDIVYDLNPDRPIYDKEHFYFDAFFSYRMKLFSGRIPATFRFNCQNIQEGGRLQPISAYPDGTPNAYRIVDPRKFILTMTLDL